MIRAEVDWENNNNNNNKKKTLLSFEVKIDKLKTKK